MIKGVPLLKLFCLVCTLGILLSACIPEAATLDPSLRETQIELNARQTISAAQETQAFLNSQTPGEPGLANTSPSKTPQETTQITANTPTTQPTATKQASATPTPDFESFMHSASILLFENMAGDYNTNRYVKDTLDAMGLGYEDVGGAIGWLKDRLLSGPPDGDTWDVIIIAAELNKEKPSPTLQGEYFELILDAIERGSSVIMEVWFFDLSMMGTAGDLLRACGVKFYADWEKVPPAGMVMFPLDATHPILNEPNNDLSFTKVSSYWWDSSYKSIYDIGDLLEIVPGSDAKFLLGTFESDGQRNGTLTVCMDDRLILQTFSSHQLTFDAMTKVWENYITFALKRRLRG